LKLFELFIRGSCRLNLAAIVRGRKSEIFKFSNAGISFTEITG